MLIKRAYISLLMMIAFSCKKEEIAPLPIVGFFVEITECTNGVCNVDFYDDSENVIGWKWSVGNETVSNLKNCTVSLVQGVVYKVRLKAINSDGVEGVKIKNVTI